jgi:hypothetical protein
LQQELIQALLAPCPEILTSLKAAATLGSDQAETVTEEGDEDAQEGES